MAGEPALVLEISTLILSCNGHVLNYEVQHSYSSSPILNSVIQQAEGADSLDMAGGQG